MDFKMKYVIEHKISVVTKKENLETNRLASYYWRS